MRLILFDVDGTLVTVRGAGRRAFARALESTFGTAEGLAHYDLRGKTDLRIVFEVTAAAGIPDEQVRERLDECFEAYLRALVEEIGDARDVLTMPGVPELVARLDAHTQAALGLLTGNIEEGARIKLGPTGLWPYFRTGAFGSDDADRRRLPSLAARRAHALLGHPFPPPEVVIVGDTPWDIDCARAFGARAVAVAEAPDLFFDTLADTERVLAALLAGE
jgi:phosphoglycolate phosphatase-like HAD superfamily hydrolase